jgi:hypothetical protein
MASNITGAAFAPTALTFTALNSLASDAALLAGASSLAWDLTTTKDEDIEISGHIVTGSVAPTAGTFIYIYAIIPEDDVPTWPDVFDGTAAAKIISSSYMFANILYLIKAIQVPATTAKVMPIPPVSIRQITGLLYAPPKGQIWVVQNTGQALATTGHVINIRRKQRVFG